MIASPIPMFVEPPEGPYGTLYGHVARANVQWKTAPVGEAMALFMGANAYVTPSWYQTKRETGMVVPTWNYMAVHAYGTPRLLEDSAAALAVVERLSGYFEAALPQPWSTATLPPGNALAQMRGIVAFEIPIDRLEAKAKLGQNRQAADRQSAADALDGLGGEDNAAVAALMRKAGQPA
jgi:transcriptional regulator